MKFARTIRFDAAPLAADRAALLRSIGASARTTWLDDTITGRAYALVESAEPVEASVGRPFEGAIIALAVTPSPAEAFPALHEALAGAGRPAGMLSCERAGDELAIEWDPQVTRASLVLAAIDTELARFHGTRRARLLAPLPDDIVAAIAADGLGARELDGARIIETYMGAGDGLA